MHNQMELATMTHGLVHGRYFGIKDKKRRMIAAIPMLLMMVIIFCFSAQHAKESNACSDEFHQFFVPGRSCEFRDVLIDTNGVLIGILVTSLVLSLVKRRKGEGIPDRNDQSYYRYPFVMLLILYKLVYFFVIRIINVT